MSHADSPVSDRSLTAADVDAYLRRCGEVVRRHASALTRLDAVLGDGDHGDNLSHGFAVLHEELAGGAGAVPGPEGAAPRSVEASLRAAGHALVGSVGGASGPLYGSAFLEAAYVARAAAAAGGIGVDAVAQMLEAGAASVARRGRCEVGDKTILDTLRPAADAFGAAATRGEPMVACLQRAIAAGRAGMRSTVPLVARRGLAMRLGARSAGHLDPGAVSCFLLLRAMVPGARDRRRP